MESDIGPDSLQSHSIHRLSRGQPHLLPTRGLNPRSMEEKISFPIFPGGNQPLAGIAEGRMKQQEKSLC